MKGINKEHSYKAFSDNDQRNKSRSKDNGAAKNQPLEIHIEQSHDIESIVSELKIVIDQFDSDSRKAKDLILELARILDELGQYERSQISRKIKEILEDKIREGKITAKWIHEC